MKRHNETHKDHGEEGRKGLIERWRPERMFLSSLNDIERVFEDALHAPFFGMHMPHLMRDFERMAQFMPSVDVIEHKEELIVKAELPGMTKEDIHVNMEGNCLILSGEKKTSTEKEREGMMTMERRYGTFKRALLLPDGVEAEKITAAFKNGVLEIHIPRKELESGRNIPVN